MPVQIVPKGESVSMRGAKTVSRALVGLGWKVNEGQSNFDLDLDVAAVGRNAAGEAVVAAYFNDLSPAPWVTHQGDNLTGAGDGDDEIIHIDFSQVPDDIIVIQFSVHMYEAAIRGQSFGMVEEAYCRVENLDTSAELVRADLTGDDFFDGTGVLIASFVRNGRTWDFLANLETRPEWDTLANFVSATVK